MGVPACSSCNHCGSDFAQSPEGHSEPDPHEYVIRYNELTGVAYELCMRCMKKRSEIEEEIVAPIHEEQVDESKPLDDPYLKLVGQYPHCDQYVLHPKSTCEYCDLPKNEPLHVWREEHGINHTGENDPNKTKCPAETRRAKSKIDEWRGNRAK
jgi:hypothetical protein